MSYKVVSEILGFKDMQEIVIEPIDDFFSKMSDANNKNISFILVNPHLLREYSFNLPQDMKTLLKIDNNTNITVYNILLIQKPLEKSTINFLAPIVINNDNKTVAQVVLEPKQNPDFGMAERIESFKQEK
ncbi:flagellar assembly protein FliW [Sulfurimonas sp.]|uniref:flagellar assembly protein FliW n=1 Tax=Sulfurimonas sp. TaxID=2022749 RepID=UPI0026235272|nr:flagellar assembly protein FliW [Sulfurimonas sp.]